MFPHEGNSNKVVIQNVSKQTSSHNLCGKKLFVGTCLSKRCSSNRFLTEGLESPVQRLLCVCLDHSTNDVSC